MLGTALRLSGEARPAEMEFRAASASNRSRRGHNNWPPCSPPGARWARPCGMEHAIRASPEDARLHVNLGKVLLHLGEAAQARSEFEKALALASDDAEARAGLATALSQTRAASPLPQR